ncbi:prenyltransferase/squalene oxidase repeat-containing protein [Limnoglobus roseus]|uniref:Prenyltransferase alpha-alpha toroid domain-containing protein n=1 Tax=Limnoglobus roseus TaxID=2598579 RepID=A0A5C1AG15_9BACT|nr:prenyltransferase/squalene oxidase repeat-containing protein [Limnoglobus roseus]QEL15928.1 hypothetical protein PX52LOC_02864 [Limnoglobus roseus]
MRLLLLAIAFALPSFASAQTAAEKQATLQYLAGLQDAATGTFKLNAKTPPGLRATSSAVRATRYLGGDLAHKDKITAFVLSCYDPATGGFHELDAKPDVTVTAIGVMAAVELGIPEAKFPKAVEYLHANAKTFEDVRIGAAALEALEKKPDWTDAWIKLADAQLNNDGTAGKGDGLARDSASVAAMKLRLGYPLANKAKVIEQIKAGQRPDGAWGKAGAKGGDGETTYRVMRSLMLAKEKPRDAAKLREFFAACRNADGGYGVAPGEPSSVSGVYYQAIVAKWLK